MDGSSLKLSSNCKSYTDSLSVLVTGTASLKEKPGLAGECLAPVALPAVWSCQRNAYEKPDEVTENMMRFAALDHFDKMGCQGFNVADLNLNFNTTVIGTKNPEKSAKEMAETGTASNCHVMGNAFDINDSFMTMKSTCYNTGDYVDERGQTVRNYNIPFTSSIISCDSSDDAWPQLQEDGRKTAAYLAEKAGLRPKNVEDLSCTFSLLAQGLA